MSNNKVWLDSYPEHMPKEIDDKRYEDLIGFFEKTLNRRPDNLACINMGKTLTFRKLEERSRYFAAFLQNELKLEKGDRIALMMPNVLQYPIALLGALRAGLTVVNVNPLYTPRELKHQLCDSGAKAIVVVTNFAATLEEIVKETPVEHVILSRMGDELSFGKRTLVNFIVKYVKKLVPHFKLPHAVGFRYALGKGKRMEYTRPEIKSSDLAFLQYTGGTTGVAKGAMLSHANMVANIVQSEWVAKTALSKTAGTIGVCALPFYHIFALTINCLLFLELGMTALLISNPRDIKGFVKELKKYNITSFTGVNTLFNALLNEPSLKEVDFSELKLSIGGGATIQKKVAQRWKDLTNSVLIEGYGMTECSPLVSATRADAKDFSGSIGIPIPNTDIKIIKENGEEAKRGERGELWVKGPQVMQGYWQREDETEKSMSDGWMMTGDVVEMDENNNLHIVDRKKDMIIVSGFNVYPNEIEEVVSLHPKVSEVAAIGVPNERSGESIKVLVTPSDKSLTVEELRKHCRKYLTGYKVPKEFEFTDDLPKSNIGKILRRVVREQYLAKLGE